MVLVLGSLAWGNNGNGANKAGKSKLVGPSKPMTSPSSSQSNGTIGHTQQLSDTKHTMQPSNIAATRPEQQRANAQRSERARMAVEGGLTRTLPLACLSQARSCVVVVTQWMRGTNGQQLIAYRGHVRGRGTSVNTWRTRGRKSQLTWPTPLACLAHAGHEWPTVACVSG
eukprot:5463078-Pleurochrysis_carterae.AAC.1